MRPPLRFVCSILFACGFILLGNSQAQTTPRIFHTDLQSGPASSGQGGRGTFVTIYGKGFGATRGTSTVSFGSVSAYSYPVWTDTKITFQTGNLSISGTVNISVNVGGAPSNAVPFTVRPGRIYFVSPTGSDSQRGSYNRPWRTLAKAVATMSPGDIVYAMNITEGAVSTATASLAINRAGTTSAPFAIVAYPGSTPTVGSETGPQYGIQAPTGGYSSWVISGLKLRGLNAAVYVAGATNWRLVGNDVSCPSGTGSGGCLRASSTSGLALLGNTVHDSGAIGSTTVANYDSVDVLSSNNVEIAWNRITNTRSCKALNVAGTTSASYALSIHDNLNQNAVCDGISLSGVDASQGTVELHNNIIENAGTGPAPGGVEASYTCAKIGGSGLGEVMLHNNTMYRCGARANYDSGALAASTPVHLLNNVVYVDANQAYVSPNTNTSWISGSNNLFYGAGAAPGALTNTLSVDPRFADPANHNFRLQSSSPAIDQGVASNVAKDYDGTSRPQGRSEDLGAFEFSGAATGAPQLSFNPSSVSFGSVTVGTGTTQTVSVYNTGTASTTLTQLAASGAVFSVSGISLPQSLAPGQTASFAVTFTPQSAGSATGSVSALVSGSSTPLATLQLSGSGLSAAGSLSASATSLAFGTVTTGTTSSRTVTLTANGGPVTISQAVVSGTGFTVSGATLPVALASGQSVTFTVTFSPAAAASYTGTLSLSSDATNSPNAIALSGTGAAVVTHSVTLSWTASTSTGVVGYRVYRSTVSGSSYVQIGSQVTGTTYTDSSVTAGATYYYVVRSVDASGNQSANSTQATAVIPTP